MRIAHNGNAYGCSTARKEGKMGKNRNLPRVIVTAILIVLAAAALGFIGVYYTRFQSMNTVKKLTDYEDGYNLYRMDILYDYDLDHIIDYGIEDTQTTIRAFLRESLPFLPVHIELPSFSCSAFTMTESDKDVCMGRNYDFKNDTSAMLVHCTPKDGYESIAFAALNNIGADAADESIRSKLAALTGPFIFLDGLNEKGVSIAVLTLDSEPTVQDSGKPNISTSLAIRLVLDRAATTEEAVELLKNYDMIATAERDYHFYITDASGDGRVVEYDCESEDRELKATPTDAVTNFYILYKDSVEPNQKNGIYGHGRERYDIIEEILDEEKGNYSNETEWRALQEASQDPNPEDVTSNTQWSIVYNNTELTAQIAIRRRWSDVKSFSIEGNEITSAVN